MRHQLETSLLNLRTEYVDIYFFHNFNFGTDDEYLDDAVAAMRRFREEGKIRAIGMRGPHRYAPDRELQSNDCQRENKYDRFLQTAKRVDPDIIQLRYNILTPADHKDRTNVFDWARQRNVGVVMNKPLGQGLLLDKYDPECPPRFAEGDHRRRKRWFGQPGLRALKNRLAQLQERFGSGVENLLSLCISYCLERYEQACVLIGFTDPAQVEMNFTARRIPLTSSDLDFIRTTMAGLDDEIGEFFVSEEYR